LHLGQGFSEVLTSFLTKLKSLSSLFKVKVQLIVELCEILSLLLGKAVCTVVNMFLGKLANIGFPAKILTVDE